MENEINLKDKEKQQNQEKVAEKSKQKIEKQQNLKDKDYKKSEKKAKNLKITIAKDKKNSDLENQVKVLNDKYLRLFAEMENYKKRQFNEKITERKYATYDLVQNLLEIIDAFEKALNIDVKNPEMNNFLQGFSMVYEQLMNLLKNNEGITEIDALGTTFDPNLHQAILQGEDKKQESGIVLEVLKKGYKYKDRVISHSMVKVNK